jgi:hypothetical protein
MLTRGMVVLSLFGFISAPAFGASTWANCRPNQVMVFDNRVHVECSSSVGRIKFFAFPTADNGKSARVLSLLSTAQVAGRTLTILYDPADASGQAYGCLVGDCRPILGVGFGN